MIRLRAPAGSDRRSMRILCFVPRWSTPPRAESAPASPEPDPARTRSMIRSRSPFPAALVRRCGVQNVPAMVTSKGHDSAGGVFVKVNHLDGNAEVFSQARRGDGTPVWMCATGDAPVVEREADEYIARQKKFDPDIWVVEIEDKQGRHFLEADVDTGSDLF